MSLSQLALCFSNPSRLKPYFVSPPKVKASLRLGNIGNGFGVGLELDGQCLCEGVHPAGIAVAL